MKLALAKSIVHWMDNLYMAENDKKFQRGSYFCALCQLHNVVCEDCILYKYDVACVRSAGNHMAPFYRETWYANHSVFAVQPVWEMYAVLYAIYITEFGGEDEVLGKEIESWIQDVCKGLPEGDVRRCGILFDSSVGLL